MTPKGKLLIIGGAEDKGGAELEMEKRNTSVGHFDILEQLLPVSKDSERIEVFTTGSEVEEEMKSIYKKAFRKIGYKNVGFIMINDIAEAREESYVNRAREANVIFFTGGDQFRISSIIGGTEIAEVIRNRYKHDSSFVVAGTSAGAMAMSKIMICAGGTEEALIDKDVHIASGLGLLEDCIIDTHFIRRGRIGRLSHAVVINPGQLGVGLGEDTALLIKNGTDAECFGSGMVVVIDGMHIDQTNITEVEEGDPVFVGNLIVHLLTKGCRFSLKERRLETPAISRKKT
jgi:cyanophycinase